MHSKIYKFQEYGRTSNCFLWGAIVFYEVFSRNNSLYYWIKNVYWSSYNPIEVLEVLENDEIYLFFFLLIDIKYGLYIFYNIKKYD